MPISRFASGLACVALFACLSAASAAPPLDDRLKQVEFLIENGQHARALENLELYLAKNPRNPRARFLKAVILAEQKKIPEAIKAYNELIHEHPDMAEPYNNLAVLHASLGQYEPARMALETATRNKPDFAVAHENLGDVYARMAAQSYEKAAQHDKSNKSAPLKLKRVTELLSSNRP